MTARWSDLTSPLSTIPFFQRNGQLVWKTSKMRSPQVGVITNCCMACCRINSSKFKWLMSPAIMMLAFGSSARIWSHVSDIQGDQRGHEQDQGNDKYAPHNILNLVCHFAPYRLKFQAIRDIQHFSLPIVRTNNIPTTLPIREPARSFLTIT